MSVETSATAAKERAEAIRSGIDAIAAALQEVPRLIIEARKAEDWKALDYASWDDYVSGEFGMSLIKLDKPTRKQWAIALKDAGMTTREIAPVTNSSQPTVVRDLRDSNESRPAPPEKTGTGKSAEQKLWDAVLAANKSLYRVCEMMQDGVKMDGNAQESFALTVRLAQDIINVGARGETQ
jgi:hypothetical protein